MTRFRNIQPLSRALLRGFGLCLFALVVLLPGQALAFYFAPMCDEDGSSAIAPIPITPRDHGEIQQLPCPPAERDDDTAAALSSDQGEPPLNVQLPMRHFAGKGSEAFASPHLEALLVIVPRAPNARELTAQVYRPPR